MVNRCRATLRPQSKCSVTIRFSPTGYGWRGGTLTINSNASNSPNSVVLIGKGTHARKWRPGDDQRTVISPPARRDPDADRPDR
jgi:hypothetical protein